MIITWDNAKRLANLDKHGLDFADLEIEFFLDSLVVPGRVASRRSGGSRGET